ncbi:hypothetical protein BS78_04G079000 [Paspalum vaginatum]|nr:hypothetical protein BS78_04G079000 [Paspalum vaginatum]
MRPVPPRRRASTSLARLPRLWHCLSSGSGPARPWHLSLHSGGGGAAQVARVIMDPDREISLNWSYGERNARHQFDFNLIHVSRRHRLQIDFIRSDLSLTRCNLKN